MTQSPSKAAPNYEYMHYALRTWGQSLYSREQYKRSQSAERPFNGQRDLSRGETLSEQAFVLTCVGMAQAERVLGRTLVNAFSKTAPVEAWRRSVHRNSYRADLDALDTLLQEKLSVGQRDVAVGAFPAGYDTGIVREALQHLGWTPKQTGTNVLMQLLDEVDAKVRAAPKAEQPQP